MKKYTIKNQDGTNETVEGVGFTEKIGQYPIKFFYRQNRALLVIVTHIESGAQFATFYQSPAYLGDIKAQAKNEIQKIVAKHGTEKVLDTIKQRKVK